MMRPIWTAPEPLGSAAGCVVARPRGASGPLPVLYLLHGQLDTEKDWWSARGQLGGILAGVPAIPMLVVMPFCAREKRNDPTTQREPPLNSFRKRFEGIRSAVESGYPVDPERRGVLGISMGGKQALALALPGGNAFSALGVLSGKLQAGENEDHYGELETLVGVWPEAPVPQGGLYFHYCGRGGTDDRYYPNNARLCSELGGELRVREGGDHNWYFWRSEVAEFVRRVSDLWSG